MFKWLNTSRGIGIALGAWLIAVPWIFDFTDHRVAMLNATLMGGVLMIEELVEGHGHAKLDAWLDHATGLWLCVSPLLLGYPGLLPASLSMLMCGVLTLALRETEHRWHEAPATRAPDPRIT